MLEAEWQETYEIKEAAKAPSFAIRWPRRRSIIVFISIAVAVFLMAGVIWEMRTSRIQARVLSGIASKLSFQLEAGPSDSIRFPKAGPLDRRLGYASIQSYTDRLTENGYSIDAQTRFSPQLSKLSEKGIFIPYHEKSQAGLRILDRDNKTLSDTCYPGRVYRDFDEIPDLVVRTLLFIENRELLDTRHPYRNPAVEWDRLAKVSLDMAIHLVKEDHKVPGGSTLATQLQKYKHSPDGRTGSPTEKFRQMVSAMLKSYMDGEKTMEAQRQIVLEYINSIPLAASPGYGEVHGLGDGLWSWYGADFDLVNHCLNDADSVKPEERALAYKQVLSLFLAHRLPTHYLVEDQDALKSWTDRYVTMLSKSGVISKQMRDDMLKIQLHLLRSAPIQPDITFVERKAVDDIRAKLSAILDVPSLYDLDRLDLTVKSTLDAQAQDEVVKVLQQLSDPKFVKENGLVGENLLNGADPSEVVYSFTLYERLGGANLLRVQADSFNQPLNINEGIKLELGSTAKIRTLATYLEIIAELHEKYASLPREELAGVHAASSDHLTQWAIDYLSRASDRSLSSMLEAAVERRYSASPYETFFTGGGEHTFVNYDKDYNGRIMSVREGFHNSVNLVFIRLMRDIVRYHMFHLPTSTARILEDRDDPNRRAYLERFADQEGRVFLSRFYGKYRGKNPDEAMNLLLQRVYPMSIRLATVFRSVAPEADIQEFTDFMRAQLPDSRLDDEDMAYLYDKYSKSSFNLSDRGYIARVHPLEIWTVEYLRRHPEASRNELIAASTDERQEVYRWLFKTSRKHAQDIRIRTLLEAEAFEEIHNQWQRLGYPFDSLVPSYATAIGSSADRPASLAELVGIILNGGVRYPMVKVQELHFAEKTPYETILRRHNQQAERVLAPEVAQTLRNTLFGVVERGTAMRVRYAFKRPDGSFIAVGGKTGTGDNRREVYGTRGRLIKSDVINRTATFVFIIGDRFFGTVTAYVDGQDAAKYEFTSSLPVQVLKAMVPKLMPLVNAENSVTDYYALRSSDGAGRN